MVFNVTFNNISIISWRSIILVEETYVPGKNTDLPQVTDNPYQIMLFRSYGTLNKYYITLKFAEKVTR